MISLGIVRTPSAMFHPCPDEHGLPVRIANPSLPGDPAAWTDATRMATVVPGGAMPAALNGIVFAPALLPLVDAPVPEPPYLLPAGMRAAAGAIIVEDDGRVWLVAPTNGFGGYAATFPKGRIDGGMDLQATAVREAFEESGLAVALLGFLADVPRTQTYTRYYMARRVGGNPALMGWETQAVHLVPLALLPEVAVHANDMAVIAALRNGIRAGT
nr:NUDIX hydrolase [uncultured Massilia sp.]